VLLIDPDGKQLGIKPLPEALGIARQLDLDLVEVAADANPPVCRIMDFNRFKYEAAQRAKESRRKATTTGIKEMKYRPKIGIGDFDTKTRQVGRFLGDGHKVKVTIMFRGREMSHPELGKKILDQVAESVSGVAKIEAAPKLDGRNMIMVLAPDRRAQVKKQSANGSEPPAGRHATNAAPGTSPPVSAGTAQNLDPVVAETLTDQTLTDQTLTDQTLTASPTASPTTADPTDGPPPTASPAATASVTAAAHDDSAPPEY
jgi:translation initiation factor IF-3